VTHKLLLADDSVTIQRVVELTFSGEDVQVVTVGDGEQAIARIPVEMPDIVLADIGMPKRSGYDVAAFVKGRPDLAHIPVLLLAGAFEPVDEARAQHVHSDGVLVKPFEPQQVISRVRGLIDKARTAAPRSPAAPDVSLERHGSTASHEASARSPQPGLAMFDAHETHEAPSSESRLVSPPSPEPPVEDYFERLDAAFAQLATEPERHAPSPSSRSDAFDGDELPTVESLLASSLSYSETHTESLSHGSERPAAVELTDKQAAIEHAPAPSASAAQDESGEPSGGRNLVADMFAALFAVEQGEAVAPPLPLPAPRREAPVVTDALVDEVTRRVIERLAPETATELVAQIVSEVAERLVREEIARIKSAVGSRL
jgi:CheY-like chemotaxis protein